MSLLCTIILFSLASFSYSANTEYRTPLDWASDSEGKTIPMTGTESDASLQTKIKKATKPLEQTITNLTKTNTQLKIKLSNLKEVNSQKTSQKQECSAATKQVEALTTKLSKAEGKVKSLTLELSRAEEEVKTKRREKLELKTQLDNIVKQLKDVIELQEGQKSEREQPETAGGKATGMTTTLCKAEKVEELQRQNSAQEKKSDKSTERMTTVTTTSTTTPPLVKRCPGGFTNDKKANICYQFVRKFYTHWKAESWCKRHSGRLAVLNTAAKFSAVRTAAGKGSSKHFFFRGRQSYWVGTEANTSGDMKWSDGISISSLLLVSGMPNSKAKQCGKLDNRRAFRIVGDHCHTKNFFVCEVV